MRLRGVSCISMIYIYRLRLYPSSMRFLCLHGMGENGRVFEAQTAAIRHHLGPLHSYEWVEGTVATAMAPGLEALVTPEDEFLMYVDDSLDSRVRALSDMKEYIADEGPFDALLAFSQGASCGASLLLHLQHEHRKRDGPASPFKCAVFFCGGPPEDPQDLELGVARIMNASVDGEVLDLPTGHVWGRKDDRYGYGPELSALCCGDKREVFIHEGGHEIPGVRDPEGILKAVQVVKRTLARAELDS